ncbi:factor of DNA methylation 4-like [Lycium ferocissimum]|uniref:factor of DNA methylation 4-like n=1 Tax=Lycium ferocissimum TaxID=112874 RepID=UPI002815EEEF|nr:factor of DNA methylation 4-like [Lycium ferocissimum]
MAQMTRMNQPRAYVFTKEQSDHILQMLSKSSCFSANMNNVNAIGSGDISGNTTGKVSGISNECLAKLAQWIIDNGATNHMNDRAAMEQKTVDESVLSFAEEQKKVKETLRQQNMELQKKLDLKQVLDLEIERLRGAIQVTKHMEDGQDGKKKLEEIEESLNDKKEELEDLEALNQALVVKEQKANVELKDARKELIDVMKHYSSRALIGVKRMGELDMKNISRHNQDKIPWKRLKMIPSPSNSRCITTEMWNYKLGRKATLNEGITYVLQKLKASKAKRR